MIVVQLCSIKQSAVMLDTLAYSLAVPTMTPGRGGTVSTTPKHTASEDMVSHTLEASPTHVRSLKYRIDPVFLNRGYSRIHLFIGWLIG